MSNRAITGCLLGTAVEFIELMERAVEHVQSKRGTNEFASEMGLPNAVGGYVYHYPTQAFDYFRSQGVPHVICEEKHMGSRAVVVVCKDADSARERFGVTEGESGIVYTRTGKGFFNDAELEVAFLDRIVTAMSQTGFWDKFSTTWACLDCELMPWSAKAQELLRSQYAAVGAAGRVSVPNETSGKSHRR